MSTSPTGVGAVIDDTMRKALAEQAADAERQEQLDMLEPLDSEELLEARERLGDNASHLAVVREARSHRKGRKPGSRNRRTDDTVAYLSQFGPDPLVAAMKIIATTEELMVERSKAVDPAKRVLTFGEAQAHRMRMIELAAPYWHGKKPVQIEHSFAGVGDLIFEEVTGVNAAADDVMDADFLPLEGGDK